MASQTNKYDRYGRQPTLEDIERTVLYLCRAFSNATFKASHIIGNKADSTTELYSYQVDFAYLIITSNGVLVTSCRNMFKKPTI